MIGWVRGLFGLVEGCLREIRRDWDNFQAARRSLIHEKDDPRWR